LLPQATNNNTAANSVAFVIATKDGMFCVFIIRWLNDKNFSMSKETGNPVGGLNNHADKTIKFGGNHINYGASI
jgi:hypothetical protein